MGLAEKRVAKEFQDGPFLEWQKKINEAAGITVAVEVKWEQLMEDGMSHMFLEAWPKVYFEPIVSGLQSICADAMGKEAIQGALKKIEIVNENSIYYGDRCSSFAAGVLKIDHQPFSNLDDTKDRIKGVIKTLENSL